MATPGPICLLEETCITSMRSTEYVYTWAINDFSVWQKHVERVHRFFVLFTGDQDGIKWELFFDPEFPSSEHVAFRMPIVTSPSDKFNATFYLAMKDTNDNVIRHDTLAINHFKRFRACGWFLKEQRETLLEKLKPSDQLIVHCKIVVTVESLIKQSEPLPSSLIKDLKSLLDGDKFGDVTILVAGQRFLAHKCILSARSSVFNAMFEHQMQEGIENCVTIDDVQPEVFKELLKYIYTEEVTGLELMAHGLYKAADKYDIPTLKSLCRYRILEKLSWETAAETLVVADLHGDLEMKKNALQFLSGSVAAKVTQTEGWKDLVRTYPHLVDEIIKTMAANMTISK